jgi:mRNA interferase MazF
MGFPKRSEIWLVSLDPVKGHETGKTRPALIISNNISNQYSSTVTVIPLTSSMGKNYPFEALVTKKQSGLLTHAKAKCNQIKTVDKTRLIKNTGQVLPETIKEVEEALLIHLDIENC